MTRLLPAILLAAVTLTGCNAIGPTALRTARIPYNEAVAVTRDQQMLLNVVRLKYRDIPFFLDVGSVATQYEMKYGGSLSSKIQFDDSLDESHVNAGGSLGFTEKPTLTFLPLTGEKFVKQMMAPIPLETMLLLGQSGWSMRRIWACCAQELNGVPNAPTASGPTPAQAPDFKRFWRATMLSRELQNQGYMRLTTDERPDGSRTAALEIHADAPQESLDEMRELLGLAKGTRRLPLVQRYGDPSGSDLNVSTRSLLGVMHYLSHAVDVPADHLAAGKVTVTKNPDGTEFDWDTLTGDLMHVRTSSSAPDDAYIAVEYRGAWFYIEDNDLTSKTTFALISYLFALQAGDRKTLSPTLTLPIGG